MRLREIIIAEKLNIRFMDWKQGNMPPAVFKLRSDLRTLRQGKSNQWRIVTFDAIGRSFRVLILYNPDRFIYRATLAIEDAGMATILCVHEFHASEPGWHCHADPACDKGVSHWNHRELQRWPKHPLSSADYDVDTQDRATQIALKFYRISERGSLI